MKRTITTIILLALTVCLASGCGIVRTNLDVDAALAVALDMNERNVKKVTVARVAEHDKELAALEVMFEQQLGLVKDGAAAVKILTLYRKNKVRLEANKAVDLKEFAVIIDNAVFARSIHQQRMGVNAAWGALFDRIPAIAELKTLADAKSREYVNALNEGSVP